MSSGWNRVPDTRDVRPQREDYPFRASVAPPVSVKVNRPAKRRGWWR